MIRRDLKDKMILTSIMLKTEEIFKYVKPFLGSADDKGKSYMTNGASFYVGEQAKKVIVAFLVDGTTGEEYKERFEFINDFGSMSVGVTLVAHGIQTQQRGVMSSVPNAKEIIENWIDKIEDILEY